MRAATGKRLSLIHIYPLQRITLRGLKEDSLYRFVLDDREIVKSGAYLMQAGIGLRLCGDYDSRLLILEEINA